MKKQEKQENTVSQVQTPDAARKRYFASTGEPSLAPKPEDAVAELAASKKSSGGKAIRSGAHDSLDDAVATKKSANSQRSRSNGSAAVFQWE
jgi:hypothetical protein